MPIQLVPTVLQDFELELSDAMLNVEGEPTTVTIRQATTLEAERRAEVTAKSATILDEGDGRATKVEHSFNWETLKRFDAMLTLSGCNITDVDGSDLFRFKEGRDGIKRLAMGEAEFGRAWGKLNDVITEEIHNFILVVNPTWSMKRDDLGE